ncbi:hypothetical protein Tco_0185756 [Tanacetum coccineum]
MPSLISLFSSLSACGYFKFWEDDRRRDLSSFLSRISMSKFLEQQESTHESCIRSSGPKRYLMDRMAMKLDPLLEQETICSSNNEKITVPEGVRVGEAVVETNSFFIGLSSYIRDGIGIDVLGTGGKTGTLGTGFGYVRLNFGTTGGRVPETGVEACFSSNKFLKAYQSKFAIWDSRSSDEAIGWINNRLLNGGQIISDHAVENCFLCFD